MTGQFLKNLRSKEKALFATLLSISFVITTLIFSSSFSTFLNKFLPEKFTFSTSEIEAAVGDNISGFAWSDNIGWISFNCTTDTVGCGTSNYGVRLDVVTGNLSGYAWANPRDDVAGTNNIGWISFEPQASVCPSGGNCQARLSGGQLLGWARACAGTVNGDCTGADRTDGWDGWISLNCLNTATCGTSNYAVSLSGSAFQNYSWGGEVVGWIQWNPLFGGVILSGSNNPAVALSAPLSVPSGTAGTLTWIVSNATSCTASSVPAVGVWSGSKSVTGGTQSTGNLSVDTIFTLTCTNSFGSTSDTKTVTVTPSTPPTISFDVTPSLVALNGSINASWSSVGATSCTGTGGTGTTWDSTNPKPTSGINVPIGPITNTTSFTLTCSNSFGSSPPITRPVTVISPDDFSLSSSNSIRMSALQTNSSTTTIKVIPSGSFSSNVSLSASPATLGGVPVIYSFSDNTLSNSEYSTGSNFTVTTSLIIPAGTYPITITGIGNGITKTIIFNLNVSNTRKIEEF